MSDRTPQEDLLVIEALVEYHHDRRDVQSGRAACAWILAKELAASHGLEIEDALTQRAEVEGETATRNRTKRRENSVVLA